MTVKEVPCLYISFFQPQKENLLLLPGCESNYLYVRSHSYKSGGITSPSLYRTSLKNKNEVGENTDMGKCNFPKAYDTSTYYKKKGNYKCGTHCNRTFSNSEEFMNHLNTFKVERKYKCPKQFCPWNQLGFKTSRLLKRHYKSAHGTNTHRCIVLGCEKEFRREDLLNRHVKNVHENVNSRFNKRMHANSRIGIEQGV